MTRVVPRTTVLAVVAVVIVGATLVTLSLRAPSVPMYAPTPPSPRDAGATRVGPVVVTIDATAQDQWRYFSFRLGSIVENPGSREWDLAFRRYQIISNGGREFVGQAGIVDVGAVRFADVTAAPETGYVLTEGTADPRNHAIAGWYGYGYFSHVLTPKSHVWVVRTASGHYAKMEILSYYCPRSQPGCVTLRYVYQGDGSRQLAGTESTVRAAHARPSEWRWRVTRGAARLRRAVSEPGGLGGPVEAPISIAPAPSRPYSAATA